MTLIRNVVLACCALALPALAQGTPAAAPAPAPGPTFQSDAALSVAKVQKEMVSLEQAIAIMERSELFKPDYATKWAKYDPKLASKLLDEVGDEARQHRGVPLDRDQPALQAIRIGLRPDDLQPSADRVQRRPQLVRQRGEEFVFPAIDLAQLPVRLRQLAFGPARAMTDEDDQSR